MAKNRSIPNCSQRRCFSSMVVNTVIAFPPSTSFGWGSNVTTTLLAFRPRARCTTSLNNSAWARWTPSNDPTVTTEFLSNSMSLSWYAILIERVLPVSQLISKSFELLNRHGVFDPVLSDSGAAERRQCCTASQALTDIMNQRTNIGSLRTDDAKSNNRRVKRDDV